MRERSRFRRGRGGSSSSRTTRPPDEAVARRLGLGERVGSGPVRAGRGRVLGRSRTVASIRLQRRRRGVRSLPGAGFLARVQQTLRLWRGVFYLRYLRNELLRRRTRTVLTTLGLAVGVALVIVIASLARGLDRAQKKALNPLSSIGTDLTVTLAPQQDTGGGFGGGGLRRRPGADSGEPVGDHRSVEARKAGHPLRPRLLPAGDTADLSAEPGEADPGFARASRSSRAG